MRTNTKCRRNWCWVCDKYFRSSREAAMCCSASCRQFRSRFAKKNGRFPNRDEANYLWRQTHPVANAAASSQS